MCDRKIHLKLRVLFLHFLFTANVAVITSQAHRIILTCVGETETEKTEKREAEQ